MNLPFGQAIAQAPDPGDGSTSKYEVRERHGVMVAMRDGVRLALNIYMPTVSAKLPVILQITPYSRETNWNRDLQVAQWFAQRGYVFVIADSRGRFDSEGKWDPFDARHKT